MGARWRGLHCCGRLRAHAREARAGTAGEILGISFRERRENGALQQGGCSPRAEDLAQPTQAQAHALHGVHAAYEQPPARPCQS